MGKYEENYTRYLNYYLKRIREKYPNLSDAKLDEEKRREEDFYRSMPILHSTSIDNIDSILKTGLQSFRKRGASNYSRSAIFEVDHLYGLDSYVFANIGKIPPYGSDKTRVTLVISDEVCTSENFFTFRDLAMSIHFSGNDIYLMQEANRIRVQYNDSRLPLNQIWSILGLNSLASRELNGKRKTFPYAIDPDFMHQNGGIPEIKIGSVSPDKILGFIIKGTMSDSLRGELEAKGIDCNRILQIDSEKDELEQIIEFKGKMLQLGKMIPLKDDTTQVLTADDFRSAAENPCSMDAIAEILKKIKIAQGKDEVLKFDELGE